jgi:hypothetical protein
VGRDDKRALDADRCRRGCRDDGWRWRGCCRGHRAGRRQGRRRGWGRWRWRHRRDHRGWRRRGGRGGGRLWCRQGRRWQRRRGGQGDDRRDRGSRDGRARGRRRFRIRARARRRQRPRVHDSLRCGARGNPLGSRRRFRWPGRFRASGRGHGRRRRLAGRRSCRVPFRRAAGRRTIDPAGRPGHHAAGRGRASAGHLRARRRGSRSWTGRPGPEHPGAHPERERERPQAHAPFRKPGLAAPGARPGPAGRTVDVSGGPQGRRAGDEVLPGPAALRAQVNVAAPALSRRGCITGPGRAPRTRGVRSVDASSLVGPVAITDHAVVVVPRADQEVFATGAQRAFVRDDVREVSRLQVVRRQRAGGDRGARVMPPMAAPASMRMRVVRHVHVLPTARRGRDSVSGRSR